MIKRILDIFITLIKSILLIVLTFFMLIFQICILSIINLFILIYNKLFNYDLKLLYIFKE